MCDIAYLAGIIDGEGHFGVTSQGTKGAPGIHLAIGNNSEDLIDWLASNWPGRKGKGSTVWHSFNFYRHSLREVLPEVLPHLIIKKTQAALALYIISHQYETRDVQIECTKAAIQIIEEQRKLHNRKKKPKAYYRLVERLAWLMEE